MKVISIISLLICIGYTYGKECKPVGDLKTTYDPSCSKGGMGCNAGGQSDCRFCGFAPYSDCPQVTAKPVTQITESTSKTTKTTKSTTKRTTRAPSNSSDSSSGGNCNCNHGGKQSNN
jgi:hypothetical protein